ncbi:unnamed protein product [Phytomonas sp. EM1]|nr:unnamed protein product [Phytomonas sp. EM1]|eukprot:CCW61642.1 unnamed protein product [Phytomonas sp. isolate EM1]
MGNQGIMGVHGNGYANGLKLKESKRHSENASPKKLVKIKGVSRTFEVPCDQKSPLSVRNVYSPIGYGIRRKQRALEEQRKSRTQEILEQCSNLFDSSEDNLNHPIKKSNRSVSKTSSEDRHSDEISYGRHSENCSAVAAFVMSVHPSFPAANRPTISLKVRQSLVELFGGTDLCFLSNDSEDSLVCTAVLQLTKISDVYEGSIVIYKGYDRSVVHSYVPLASVRSITRGLEPQDRELYNKSNGILRCKTYCNEVFEVELKRSFTLYYYFPTNFYASFVAFSDDDLGKWMDVINFFMRINKAFRDFMS